MLKEDSDDSDDIDEENTIVSYANFLTKNLRISAEPRLFPLYVNGSIIDYKLEDCGSVEE
jgi:hypothetical protein